MGSGRAGYAGNRHFGRKVRGLVTGRKVIRLDLAVHLVSGKKG